MRKSVLALLLACVCAPAVAQQEVQVPDLDQPTGVCADCPDPGEGGGGGTPPPPPSPTGQPSVTNSYSSDPSEGALEFVLKYTGQPQITFVVDRSTGRLYMNNGYALFEAPLSTLAADAYPNNPAAQQDFLARLQGNLNNFFEVSQGTVTGTSGSGLMWDGSGPQRRPCDNWVAIG